MAKEVNNIERETVQPHPRAIEKEVVTVDCDDGSTYVFEKVSDSPKDEFRFARREKPNGEISTRRAPLPSAVKETMDSAIERWADLGLDGSGWFK